MSGLYQKHRPTTFEGLIGNKAVVGSLTAMMSRPRAQIPNAMMFVGPSGCGKTTLARIIASQLECGIHDLQEIDAAQFRGIDTVRDIRHSMGLAPISGKTRVWIMDEVHMLTKEAQSGLLKALEDTPKHVFFLLATTDPEKLLLTVRNRCTQFRVDAFTEKQLTILMKRVLQKENVQNVPEKVIARIATDAVGSARAALVILDTIIGMEPDEMLKAAKQQAMKQNEAILLCRTLMKKPKWDEVRTVLSGLTTEDPEQLRRMMLGYCGSVMMSGGPLAPRAWVVADAFSRPFYDTGRAGLIMSCYEVVEAGKG